MLSPVVLFAYNRPDHTRRTLESLAANSLAKDSELYVFSDGPRPGADPGPVEEVRACLRAGAIEPRFRRVEIVAAPGNQGLARAIIGGVSGVMARHGRAIVLEDDAVPSADFLAFMNAALDFYADDPKVWSIGGFSFDLNLPDGYPHSVYPVGRTSSYAWGCWRDRWDRIDWDIRGYRRFRYHPWARRAFNRFGNDRSSMLDAQMLGDINSWAIRFCYNMHVRGMFTIVPVHTKIHNIGFDGSGTHCVGGQADSGGTAPGPVEREFRFAHFVGPDEDLRRQFAAHFDLPRSHRLYLFVKNNVLRLRKTAPLLAYLRAARNALRGRPDSGPLRGPRDGSRPA